MELLPTPEGYGECQSNRISNLNGCFEIEMDYLQVSVIASRVTFYGQKQLQVGTKFVTRNSHEDPVRMGNKWGQKMVKQYVR